MNALLLSGWLLVTAAGANLPSTTDAQFTFRVESFMRALEHGDKLVAATAQQLLPGLQAAVQQDPSDDFMRYALYFADRFTGDATAAAREIAVLYQHNPVGPGILGNYCYHLERKGKWKDALAALDVACASKPRDLPLETTRLLYLVRYQQYDRAIALATDLLAASPEFEFHLLLGESYLYQGDFQQGHAHLHAAVLAGMKSAQLYALLGEAFFKAGQYGNARYHLAAALQLEPDHPLALYWWARLCDRANRPEIGREYDQRAKQELLRRVAEHVITGPEWHTLGKLHRAAGEDAPAAAAFQQASSFGYTREMPDFNIAPR